MKRIIAILSCVLILILVPINANAEGSGSFENAGALYEHWTSRDELPEYITGVWSSDGSEVNLTFGVTNDAAGHEGAKLILDLVADDDTVAIAYQTYALHYLYGVQADVERYLEDDIGFKAVGVYFSTNRVEVDVDQKRLDDPDTSAVVNALTEKYGNAVFFRFTNTVYVPTIGVANSPASGFYNPIFNPISNQPNSYMPLLFAMFAMSVVCLVALFFSEYKRRKLLVLLTNSGTVTMPQSKVSYRAIENAVKKSSSTPSFETDAGIRKAIMNSQKG